MSCIAFMSYVKFNSLNHMVPMVHEPRGENVVVWELPDSFGDPIDVEGNFAVNSRKVDVTTI